MTDRPAEVQISLPLLVEAAGAKWRCLSLRRRHVELLVVLMPVLALTSAAPIVMAAVDRRVLYQWETVDV